MCLRLTHEMYRWDAPCLVCCYTLCRLSLGLFYTEPVVKEISFSVQYFGFVCMTDFTSERELILLYPCLMFWALLRLRTNLQRSTKLNRFYCMCLKNCVSICWSTYAGMCNLILLLEIKFTKALRPQYLLWFTAPDFNISFTSIIPVKWVPGSNVVTRIDLTLM